MGMAFDTKRTILFGLGLKLGLTIIGVRSRHE